MSLSQRSMRENSSELLSGDKVNPERKKKRLSLVSSVVLRVARAKRVNVGVSGVGRLKKGGDDFFTAARNKPLIIGNQTATGRFDSAKQNQSPAVPSSLPIIASSLCPLESSCFKASSLP